MKKKTVILLLSLEFLLVAGLTLLTGIYGNYFPELVSFPFYQLACLLNLIAGCGKYGGGLAMLAYAVIVLFPIGVLFFMKEEKIDKWKLASLIFLSVSVAVGMAGLTDVGYIINPNVSDVETFRTLYRAMAGLIIWSGTGVCISVFLIRNIQQKSHSELFSYARYVFYILTLLFAYSVCSAVSDTISAFLNTSSISDTIVSVAAVLVSAAIFVFQLRAMFVSSSAVEAYRNREETETVAELSGRACKALSRALIVSIGLNALFNLLKLVFARFIDNLSISVDAALVQIAILIILLALASLIRKNSRLTETNSLFI